MIRTRIRVLTAGLMLAALLLPGTARAQELTEASYARWRDYLLPKATEQGYRAIPWRTSFWDAVVEAQRRERPILLWTMNGHPLGCT